MSWRGLIDEEMDEARDSWAEFEGVAPGGFDFDAEVNELMPASFTMWTHRRVYFPAHYDGQVWVDSVPRHPCRETTYPVGG